MVRTDEPSCMTEKGMASLDIFSGRFQSGALVAEV